MAAKELTLVPRQHRNPAGDGQGLRVVAGDAAADDGVVRRTPGLRLAYVPQEPRFAPGQTVLEAAAEGLGDARRLLGEYERVAQELGTRHDAQLIERRVATAKRRLKLAGAGHPLRTDLFRSPDLDDRQLRLL